MLDEVYNRRILELAGDIPRLGRLEKPDASATAHSKLCGSTVTVDLAMKGGKVVDFAHEVRACALGQASSSIMARNVIGSTFAASGLESTRGKFFTTASIHSLPFDRPLLRQPECHRC